MREEESRDLAHALRRTEARLRVLFDESKDMILSIDGRGTIVDINMAGAQLLGFDTIPQVLGQQDSGFWSNPADRDIFMRLLKESGSVKNFEVILERRNGATVFGLASATLVQDETGEVVEIHAIVKDITARVHDAQALWKLNMELAEANQKLHESQARLIHQEKLATIGQLAAGIAHEINNPLGFLKSNYSALVLYVRAIEGFLRDAQGVQDKMIEQARQKNRIDHVLENLPPLLRDCDEGFRRIAEIVQRLRSFSRMDAEAIPAPFDINGGIQGALTVAGNEVKYVAEVALELGRVPLVECVEGEIMQVLLNIIMNAAQAIKSQGRPGKGRLCIRTGGNDLRVWIEIQDDGPGIPREVQPRIFDPFFTTKPVGQGTGLGLSISHDIIVNRHGGTLSLTSEPKQGACFRIELPVHHLA